MSREEGAATGELLVQAIQERRLVSFVYGGHRRVVEPHLLGLHAAGEAVLSAYQTQGGSETGDLPGWRTFVLAEVGQVDLLERRFGEARPGYDRDGPGMVEVFARL
ncbi:MAG TPA: hypothetical protein VNK43_04495 [Gemmatimonadales bacterium]|nr:hypothetical protein [Gemmatimonadales bacterium]